MRFEYAKDTTVINRYGRFVPCHRIPIDYDSKSINQQDNPTPFTHYMPFTNGHFPHSFLATLRVSDWFIPLSSLEMIYIQSLF